MKNIISMFLLIVIVSVGCTMSHTAYGMTSETADATVTADAGASVAVDSNEAKTAVPAQGQQQGKKVVSIDMCDKIKALNKTESMRTREAIALAGCALGSIYCAHNGNYNRYFKAFLYGYGVLTLSGLLYYYAK